MAIYLIHYFKNKPFMKNLFALTLFLIFTVACHKSDKNTPDDTIATRARIVSNLAVDGCNWHFEVANADSANIETFIPTLATEPIVKAAVPVFGTEDAYSFIDVSLKYRRANTKRDLLCGFRRTLSVEEIEVLEIKKIK